MKDLVTFLRRTITGTKALILDEPPPPPAGSAVYLHIPSHLHIKGRDPENDGWRAKACDFPPAP